MNTMEPGSGNSPKENSIQSTLIRKAVEPNYVALIAAVAILVFGFWNIMIALGNINTEITKLRIEFSELRIDFSKLENQSTENETSGMKDLNKSSNHSKVSLSTRQDS